MTKKTPDRLRVGALVKIRLADSAICNKVAILLELSEPSMMFPYQTATVMLEDGTCHDGLHPGILEIVNASMRHNDDS